MRLPDVEPELLRRAREGELGAVEAVLAAVFNLAVRMLGNRDYLMGAEG
jgi:hypothetical protein